MELDRATHNPPLFLPKVWWKKKRRGFHHVDFSHAANYGRWGKQPIIGLMEKKTSRWRRKRRRLTVGAIPRGERKADRFIQLLGDGSDCDENRTLLWVPTTAGRGVLKWSERLPAGGKGQQGLKPSNMSFSFGFSSGNHDKMRRRKTLIKMNWINKIQGWHI